MSLSDVWRKSPLCLLVLAALSLVFTACGTKPKREIIGTKDEVSGYKGKAHKEPYLAARKLLSKMKKQAEARSVVRFDSNSYDAIVLPATGISTQSQVRTVKKFIRDGGHVVMFLQNGTRNYDDFSQYSQYLGGMEQQPMKYANRLLDNYGLTVREIIDDNDNYTSGDDMNTVMARTYEMPNAADIEIKDEASRSYSVRLGGQYVIDSLSDSNFTEDDYYDTFLDQGEDCRLVSRNLYREGRITVISDARILRNPFIGDKDHAAFMMELFDEDKSILFTRGRNLAFYELMWKYFPMFLLGLIFLICVWFLGKVHRFGPTLQIVVEQPLNYLKSIDASGHFLWKHKRENYLIAALAEKAKKVSGLNVESGERYRENLQAVSDQLGIPVQKIEKAIAKVDISEPIPFIKTVQTLQTIIQHYE